MNKGKINASVIIRAFSSRNHDTPKINIKLNNTVTKDSNNGTDEPQRLLDDNLSHEEELAAEEQDKEEVLPKRKFSLGLGRRQKILILSGVAGFLTVLIGFFILVYFIKNSRTELADTNTSQTSAVVQSETQSEAPSVGSESRTKSELPATKAEHVDISEETEVESYVAPSNEYVSYTLKGTSTIGKRRIPISIAFDYCEATDDYKNCVYRNLTCTDGDGIINLNVDSEGNMLNMYGTDTGGEPFEVHLSRNGKTYKGNAVLDDKYNMYFTLTRL